MDRLIVVSADAHVGLPAAEYRPYFDSQYRDQVEAHIEDEIEYQALQRSLGHPFPPNVLEVIDRRGAITSGGYAGFFSPERRLLESERDGIVAEILHPGGTFNLAPFTSTSSRRVTPELRAAGSKAYNRFLADFCHTDRRRLLGVALTYPWPSMDDAIRTVGWARESGMAAVFPARFAGVEGDHLPPFSDDSWDPFWRACCSSDMPVHIHAGHGRPQGTIGAVIARLREEMASNPDGNSSILSGFFEDIFEERRPLWQLIWSGVFDRFPTLKVVFVEIRADWVPPTLRFLDEQYARTDNSLKMSPSEYWQRHCMVTPSFMRASDLAARHDVDVSHMMFGTDFPHAEGTWPNTLDHLRVVLDGVPMTEVRLILGENAIRYYGMDREFLKSVAERVGPLESEVVGRSGTVDKALLAHFNDRSGFLKVPQFDEARLAAAFAVDCQGVGHAAK